MGKPQVVMNRLRTKLSAGHPVMQEDVEQARLVAGSIQSTAAIALYSQLKRELESSKTE